MEKKIKVLIFVGPSGCGKTYMENLLTSTMSYKFRKLMQVTTRTKRIGESDGKPYIFVNDETYESMLSDGLLIGTTTIGDCKYGTINDLDEINNPNLKEDIDNEVVFTIILNKNGYNNFINDIKDKNLYDRIDFKVLMIDSFSPTIREGRSLQYIEEERKNVVEISDIVLINNCNNNGKFLNSFDVIKRLIEEKFI